jgi:virulence-associated protein VagC
MERIKIERSKGHQIIILPRELEFEVNEVVVKKIGNSLFVFPEGEGWNILEQGLDTFEPDFLKNGRPSQPDLEARN